jgi:hypothetical protein
VEKREAAEAEQDALRRTKREIHEYVEVLDMVDRMKDQVADVREKGKLAKQAAAVGTQIISATSPNAFVPSSMTKCVKPLRHSV